MQRENDGAEYEQMDILDREQAYLRHEAARVAAMVAAAGGHPEKAEEIEKSLLQVAGLEEFSLAA